MIGPVPCPMCGGIINKDLQALCGRAICTSCATAIAQAIPLLKTQPCRRQTICMRLQEQKCSGVRPYDPKLADLANWGITDEQINGACDMSKESTGRVSFGYVFAILRNEHERGNKPAPSLESAAIDVPVRAKEDWERLGFANQADYERWQWSYDQERLKGRRTTQAESIKMWLGEAV